MRAPTREIAEAFEAGVPLRGGVPVRVKTRTGVAVPDLAHPGRWTGWEEPIPGCILVWSDKGSAWSVSGVVVPGSDAGHVSRAIAAILGADRHGPEGEAARRTAGGHAMLCVDSMVRARTLDAVDGWIAVLGEKLDDDQAHGCMYACADADVTARALAVTCPSTLRVYVHLVPPEMATAREARRWLMGLEAGDPDPDVET